MDESIYAANIKSMRLRLQKFPSKDKQVWKVRAKYLKDWKNIKEVLYHQSIMYIPEIIKTEFISRHHNNLLASYFVLKKTQELVAQKYYYWPILRYEIKDYMKKYYIYLTSKTFRYKLDADLQFLLIFFYH